MSRLEIAKEHIEFNFSDQEYLERRTRAYRIDSDGKVDMRMTTVLMDQLDMPEGQLIHQNQDECVYELEDGKKCKVLYDPRRERPIYNVYYNREYSDVTIEINRNYQLEGLKNGDLEYMFSGEMFANRMTYLGEGVLHSSSILYQGVAIAFSAVSGTGKSTHTGLWKKYYGDQVEILNDDKPAIRFEGELPYLYGTPWSGKTEWNQNASAPLRAIFFIKRDTMNWVEPIGMAERMYNLTNQLNLPAYDEELCEKTALFAQKLALSVPMYYLHCNMEREAVEVVRRELFGGEIEYEDKTRI